MFREYNQIYNIQSMLYKLTITIFSVLPSNFVVILKKLQWLICITYFINLILLPKH